MLNNWVNYISINSSTLATSCEELTHWKRLWCWERLEAGGEGDDGGWDGWMASPTQWTWVWVNSRSWWWTGRPGVLRFMGLQRVRHDWETELTELKLPLQKQRYWHCHKAISCKTPSVCLWALKCNLIQATLPVSLFCTVLRALFT